ncbi:MAG: YihY/virulence factor BrkB family protein [Spirochaetales bacterium]|jgi:membrane protein|nr:YihY/virulence factor BrkB family protein [Spirochaetales bacterium]
MFNNLLNLYRNIKNSPFWKDILVHAASLSFKSILSLVPTLALIFSVAKGFGLQKTIEPLILNNIIVGGETNDLIPQILEYVSNTNVKALGTIGLIFIIWTAISMVSQVEDSLNSIWSVTRPRSLYRKFTDYLSILTIGPLLIAVTLSIPPLISSHFITQKLLEYGLFAGAFKFFLLTLPWLTSVAVITLIYLFIPNTKVQFTSALLAGVTAGILWQCNQFIFIKFQIGVANYNAIYGTFASFPILLLWLNAGWLIILGGGVLGYCFQNKNAHLGISHFQDYPFADKEKLLLLVMMSICRHFSNEEGGYSCDALAKELSLPVEVATDCCTILKEAGYLSQLSQDDDTCVFTPSIPPVKILISEFLITIKNQQSSQNNDLTHEFKQTIDTIIEDNEEAKRKQFKARTIASLY